MTNRERILSISKKLGLSHVGSNLSCLPVLEEIYAKKKPEDIVILDNAHAGLAHLIVKCDYDNITVIEPTMDDHITHLIEDFGIHCERKAGCDASGGSLGHGLGIGIGYALADRKRDVYVIVSEGSVMEGSFWEAWRIQHDLSLQNIHLYTNFNGYSAVQKVDANKLARRIMAFCPHHVNIRYTDNGEGFEGLDGHYKKI